MIQRYNVERTNALCESGFNILNTYSLQIGDTSIAYCAEGWGEHREKRLFYSIFSFVVQFILPLTLIALANYAIKRKLQNLPR